MQPYQAAAIRLVTPFQEILFVRQPRRGRQTKVEFC